MRLERPAASTTVDDLQAELASIQRSMTERDKGRAGEAGNDEIARRLSALETKVAAMRAEVSPVVVPAPTAAVPAAPAVAASKPQPLPQLQVSPSAAMRAPESAVAATRFAIGADEKTVRQVIARWARAAGVNLAWRSEVDYPLTDRMRGIASDSIGDAIAVLSNGLGGVSVPLSFKLSASTVEVDSPTLTPAAAVAARPAMPAMAAVAPKGPNPAEGQARRWSAAKQASLKAIVQQWANQSGIRLDWESKSDYPSSPAIARGDYTGTFKEAVGQLAANFGDLPVPLGLKFSNGGAVLRVYDMQTRPAGASAPAI